MEALGRTFKFGQVEGGDEVIAPSVEGKRACDGNGNQNSDDGDDGGDGDKGGTMSGGSIDSMQVKAALLAADNQYMHQNRGMRSDGLPMLSMPPIHHAERPYGGIRPRHRCGRIKFVPAKVSRTVKVKMTYLECTCATQPPTNDSKCLIGVIGPCC